MFEKLLNIAKRRSKMFLLKEGLILILISLVAGLGFSMVVQHSRGNANEIVYNELPGSGKKCWIDTKTYFVYKFVEQPKLGTAILKVQVFDKNGQRLTDLEVKGNYGMPSMPGAHDSGDVSFKLNKKGDYLLPVNIVMTGGWEIKLTFFKNKEAVYRSRFRFNV